MKKLLVFSMMMAVAIAANAEYLFWQVSKTAISSDSYLSKVITETDTYTYKAQLKSTGGAIGDQYVIGGDGSLEDAISVNLNSISGASTYSYFIEIYKYQGSSLVGGDSIAKSSVMSYSDLKGANYIGDMLEVTQSSLATWTGGTYSAPEPTSAMMLMLGIAFLGLKRKNG